MLLLAEIAENLIERIFFIFAKCLKRLKKRNFRHVKQSKFKATSLPIFTYITNEILSKATELGFTKITGKDEFVELSQTGMCNNFSYSVSVLIVSLALDKTKETSITNLK